MYSFICSSSTDDGQSDNLHPQVSSWPSSKGFGQRRHKTNCKHRFTCLRYFHLCHISPFAVKHTQLSFFIYDRMVNWIDFICPSTALVTMSVWLIRVFLDENLLLLLLLLKGETAMDLIKPFSLHLLSFYPCVCVGVCVFEHTLGHKCVGVSVCLCVCVREYI